MAYIGIDGEGALHIVDDPSRVPGYRTVVSSAESLRMVASIEEMDALRSKVLGVDVVTSGTDEQAATRLWYIVELYSSGTMARPPQFQGIGPSRANNHHELIKMNYARGAHWMRDKLYDKLSNQSKTIMEILAADGRMIWPESNVRDMMADNQKKFNTDRPCLEIYRYYRSRLIDAGYLKKVSYLEFVNGISRPEEATQTGT